MSEARRYQKKFVILSSVEVSTAYMNWCKIHGPGWPAFVKFIGAALTMLSDQKALPRIDERVKLMALPHGYTVLRARAAKRKRK